MLSMFQCRHLCAAMPCKTHRDAVETISKGGGGEKALFLISVLLLLDLHLRPLNIFPFKNLHLYSKNC